MAKHSKPVYICKSQLLLLCSKPVFHVSSAWEADRGLSLFFFLVGECLFVLVRGEASCRSGRAIFFFF